MQIFFRIEWAHNIIPAIANIANEKCTVVHFSKFYYTTEAQCNILALKSRIKLRHDGNQASMLAFKKYKKCISIQISVIAHVDSNQQWQLVITI